jgi:hypothetical protein
MQTVFELYCTECFGCANVGDGMACMCICKNGGRTSRQALKYGNFNTSPPQSVAHTYCKGRRVPRFLCLPKRCLDWNGLLRGRYLLRPALGSHDVMVMPARCLARSFTWVWCTGTFTVTGRQRNVNTSGRPLLPSCVEVQEESICLGCGPGTSSQQTSAPLPGCTCIFVCFMS